MNVAEPTHHVSIDGGQTWRPLPRDEGVIFACMPRQGEQVLIAMMPLKRDAHIHAGHCGMLRVTCSLARTDER